jgi:hypothetical protein
MADAMPDLDDSERNAGVQICRNKPSIFQLKGNFCTIDESLMMNITRVWDI